MYQQQGDGNQMNMYQQQSSPIQKVSKALSALFFALSVVYTCYGLIIFFSKESLIEETELEEKFIHEERELETPIPEHRTIFGQGTRSFGGHGTHSLEKKASFHSQKFSTPDEVPFERKTSSRIPKKVSPNYDTKISFSTSYEKEPYDVSKREWS